VLKVDPEFEQLYEREFRSVYRAVFLLTGDPSAAEDSTQEAFARCLERWSRLAGKPWVAGWVTTTALNHVRRSLRGRFRSVRFPSGEGDVDPRPSTVPGPEAHSASIDLWRAVRTLPPRQQQAVVLHYAMDLPLADVAEAMRVSEGAVKAHLARAREALRALVSDREGAGEGAVRGSAAGDLTTRGPRT
jgi:RNA polymerase sigma factor (sigma-70 family)